MTSRQRYKQYEGQSSGSWYESIYYGSAAPPHTSIPVAFVQTPMMAMPVAMVPMVPRAPTVQQFVYNPMSGRYELMNVIVQMH